MAAKAMILAKKMASAMTEAAEMMTVSILCRITGSAAGQTVFHFHMHLIPRYNGDTVGITWKPGELTDEDKEEILSKVKAQLA